MCRKILCITHSEDYYVVNRVMDALEKEGLEPVRVDSDGFPESIKLNTAFISGKGNSTITVEGQNIEVADIGGVWLRKLRIGKPAEDLDQRYRASCMRETDASLRGWMSSLYHLPWMDLPEISVRGENKMLQLREAASAGFDIPDTITGNEPSAVRDFFKRCEGRVVTKMLTAVSASMDGSTPFMYTSRVEEKDLEDLDSLKYCPMIFQELVEKACELRVIYVDGEIFTGAIDASNSLRGKVDWRLAATGECCWVHSDLPEGVKDTLRKFMKSMGLRYGAVDIIRTPDEKYIFLEVNPGGEWGMLEKFLEYPVSVAIAKSFKKRL